MAKREDVVWRKASKTLSKALSVAGEDYSDFAIGFMAFDARDFMVEVGAMNKSYFPVYTGNLHDSIGVRILRGNTIKRYVTMTEVLPKLAKKPQRMGNRRNIWGDEEIMRVINRPSRRTSKGVAAQLMVGVPYAESVDQKTGYFEELYDVFANIITTHLPDLAKIEHKLDV